MKTLHLIYSIFVLSTQAAFAQENACYFNERDYLDFNQDVVAAIRSGAYPSGAAHFGAYGRNENRIINRTCVVDRFGCSFDEQAYLALNPDVAGQVRGGAYQSGAAHYGSYGKNEGRPISFCGNGRSPSYPTPPPRTHEDRNCDFIESEYLLFNEDVANAVRAGSYASGYAHFASYGQSEGRIFNRFCHVRRGCEFNERDYLNFNPDVEAAIRRGDFRTAAGHYGTYGRKEGRIINARCIN